MEVFEFVVIFGVGILCGAALCALGFMYPETAKTIACCTLVVTIFLLAVVFVPAFAEEPMHVEFSSFKLYAVQAK